MSVYEDFIRDYNNMNLTAHEVRRINQLNSKEYCNLRNRAINNGDIPKIRHMNSTSAKFYYQKPNGDWSVQKQFKGLYIHVGDFPDEDTAKMIANKCKEVNWELNQIRDVIDQNKVSKVKNYTIINGYWVIQKFIDGKVETFCTVKQTEVSESVIISVVDKFRSLNWNKSLKDEVLKEFNLD